MPNAPPRHGQKRVEAARKENQKTYNRTKRTGNELYNSKGWRKLRYWFSVDNPLCVHCLRNDRVTPLDIVDHIIPVKMGGEPLDPRNLQSLCHLHHNQKTARENMEGAIHIVIGPPCAGKSTFAKKAAKKKGGVIIDFDQLAQAFGSEDEHSANDDIRHITTKARYAAIQEILKGSISGDAWIIETTPSQKMIDWYKESGAIFYLIDPTEAVCLKRAEKRNSGTPEKIRGWYKNPPVKKEGDLIHSCSGDI